MTADHAAARRVVVFEETGEEREVTGPCRAACKLTERDLRERPFGWVVSPTGVAHATNAYGDTDCGHDATRADWWWPL